MAAGALIAAVLGWVASAGEPRPIDLLPLYNELRTSFDPRRPGRGIADYPGNMIADVPKAYAMILKAELLFKGDQVGPSLIEPAGSFLISHADERHDGFPGWGVPIAWDAYGDGSINPAHTKYAISTAIVVDALLDWIDVDPKSPREKILALVRASLERYLDARVLSPSGLLPYSLEMVDRPYDTFNPAAYLAGIMQRYSHIEPESEMRNKLREIADMTIGTHLAHKQVRPDGNWYWHYSINEKVPNDLAHATYIIHGLKLYAKYNGKLTGSLDLAAIERHLVDFVDPSSNRILAWPRFRIDTNSTARSYDLGMGLFAVCQLTEGQLRERYTAALPAYRSSSGRYLKYPPKLDRSDLSVREYEAYLLLGMSSCLRGIQP
ncbi:MAG: hypothetical protein AB7E81_03530 [Hyphomicrobiaceae bacterium]